MSRSFPPNAQFWDRIAAQYAQRPVPDDSAYQQTLARVRDYLKPEDHVLELGCGTGTTALHLAPYVASVRATDISGEMIRLGQAKARAQGVENVSFSVCELGDAPADTRSYDVVMAFNLLHLLPDIEAAITFCCSRLKPGGVLITKTPCLGDSNFLFRGIIPLMRVLGRAPFVSFITEAALRSAIERVRLSVEEAGFYPTKSHDLFLVTRKPQQ